MIKHQDTIKAYLIERGWDTIQPADVAKSISIEAAELLELFQWSAPTPEEVKNNPETLEALKGELADVLIYCLEMSVIIGLDTGAVILEKLEKVKKKYPAHLFKNRHKNVAAGSEKAYWQIKAAHRKKAK